RVDDDIGSGFCGADELHEVLLVKAAKARASEHAVPCESARRDARDHFPAASSSALRGKYHPMIERRRSASGRAQLRMSSPANEIAVTGDAPAATIRCSADSWATRLMPPTASTTG